MLKIATLAVVFASSVALGNASLKTINVSFNQALGATTPFFCAIFGMLLRGQRETQETYAALVPVVAGVIIASRFDPQFVLSGFIACILATSLRALKSVLQDALLSPADGERMDSISLLAHMSPFAIIVLTPLSVHLEPGALASVYSRAQNDHWFLLLLSSNAIAAFGANLSSFLVTRVTSALTLQVLGNAKGAFAAAVSIPVFRTPVSPIWVCGYAITLGGVFWYSSAKRRANALQQHQQQQQQHKQEHAELSTNQKLHEPTSTSTTAVSVSTNTEAHRNEDALHRG